jgi:hypothetical protein
LKPILKWSGRVISCPETSFPAKYLINRLWEEFDKLTPEGMQLLQEFSAIVEKQDILLTEEEVPKETLEEVLHNLVNLQVALEKNLKSLYKETTS